MAHLHRQGIQDPREADDARPPLERVEEQSLDHIERRLELILDLEIALDLELAWMIELDLGHRLVIQHHLGVDLALGLVHEVEGLHFVLRKHVALSW